MNKTRAGLLATLAVTLSLVAIPAAPAQAGLWGCGDFKYNESETSVWMFCNVTWPDKFRIKAKCWHESGSTYNRYGAWRTASGSSVATCNSGDHLLIGQWSMEIGYVA